MNLARRPKPICEVLLPMQARELRAMVVCVVCGRPIEPRTEEAWRTMESVCVHEGECWLKLKRGEP